MPRKKKTEIGNKLPPQDIEAEKALLGCMLLDEETRLSILEFVKKDFFYDSAHQHIFSSIATLFEKGKKCDLITLSHQLKQDGKLEEVGGAEYLTEILELIPSAAFGEEYAKIVRDKYILRSLATNATQIVSEVFNERQDVESLLDKAETLIFEVSQNKIQKEAVPIKELVKENLELFEKIHLQKHAITGIPTGFIDLDDKTTGLQPSDLIIIASRPAMGKTALACNIALNISLGHEKKPVLIFSMEMSKHQVVQRMLCTQAKMNLFDLRKGYLSDDSMGKLLQAAGSLEESPIFIDDTPALNSFEIRTRARRLKSREDIQLVIVDYLQLMRGTGRAENRQQEITQISASLKALAKELNIPVIAISQLSRAVEQRGGDKKPQLSDLRESGAIEQDADIVLLLYRESYYNDEVEDKRTAEVIIAKQRNGPTGTIKLTFLQEYTLFENASFRTNVEE